MRRFFALARTAALESLSEPLSAVVFLAGLLTIHLAPVFHYHRFGEVGRLPRECGLSALLVFGLVFATSAAVRTIGRELSSGTAAAALALAVPRAVFHCAKTAGVFGAFFLFFAAAFFATLLSVQTSLLGEAAAASGENVRLWGPGLASGVGFTLLAFSAAAAANRFARWRFCVSACLFLSLSQVLAGLVAFLLGGWSAAGTWTTQAMRLFPVFAVLSGACCVFVSLAAACATRLEMASVSAFLSLGVAASFLADAAFRLSPAAGYAIRAVLPALSDYWLADRLLGGGALALEETLRLLSAAVLWVVFWLVCGALSIARRELS